MHFPSAVQDVDAEMHFWVRPSPRLVCSDRPEVRVLSCLDPPATQAIPAICVRGSGISVQGPALRAVPVASRLHQSRGGGPCPSERAGCAHSQLPRRLAHTCSLAGSCLHTGTWCSSTSACWAFGSTGKRANSCQRRGSLFSAWSWIRSTKQHASPRNVLSRC